MATIGAEDILSLHGSDAHLPTSPCHSYRVPPTSMQVELIIEQFKQEQEKMLPIITQLDVGYSDGSSNDTRKGRKFLPR